YLRGRVQLHRRRWRRRGRDRLERLQGLGGRPGRSDLRQLLRDALRRGRALPRVHGVVHRAQGAVGRPTPTCSAPTAPPRDYIRQPSTAMYRLASPFGLTRITGARQVEGTSNELSLIRASPLRSIGTCPVVAAAVVSMSEPQ